MGRPWTRCSTTRRTFRRADDGAAVATLLFALLGGVAPQLRPRRAGLGGALEALKNIVYVLTVPVFDIVAPHLTRRRNAANQHGATEGPSLLTVAIVSALVLFISSSFERPHRVSARQHLRSACMQSIREVDVGQCLSGRRQHAERRPSCPSCRPRARHAAGSGSAISSGFAKTLLLFHCGRGALLARFLHLLHNTPDAVRRAEHLKSDELRCAQIALQVR